MCTISINPGSIIGVSTAGGTITVLTVSGTVANCSTNTIKVTATCQGYSAYALATISGNTWTATNLDVKCLCGTPVTITATCQDPTPCTDTLNNITPICSCCPTGVSTGPICVEYNSAGQALVKFTTNVNVPAGCAPVIVQRDFGDGYLGSQKTYPNQSQPDTEIHIYNTSSGVGNVYTSIVNILSPSSCPPSQTTVTISQPPLCATNSLVAAICRILQFFFLLTGSTAIVFFISKLGGCSAVSFSLIGGLAASAVIFLLIIWAACRDCVCAFLQKLLGQLLLVIGVLLSMFIVQIACLQLTLGPPFTPLTWIILITVVVLYFAYLVLHGLWYRQGCCPVTICDFWQAVIFAMIVVFAAALVAYLVLAPGVQALGLVLALVFANAIMTFAGIQINLNQNANNC
jgi:hypothetical protein